jgi:hypothetical protein
MKGSGRSLILNKYPGIRLEVLRKPRKTSVKIAGFLPEILTRDLPNTKQEYISGNEEFGCRKGLQTHKARPTYKFTRRTSNLTNRKQRVEIKSLNTVNDVYFRHNWYKA